MEVRCPANMAHIRQSGSDSGLGSQEKVRELSVGVTSSLGSGRVLSVQLSIQEHLVDRVVNRFQGGLVFQAHRLLYHSTLGSRVIKKKKKEQLGRRRLRCPPLPPAKVTLHSDLSPCRMTGVTLQRPGTRGCIPRLRCPPLPPAKVARVNFTREGAPLSTFLAKVARVNFAKVDHVNFRKSGPCQHILRPPRASMRSDFVNYTCANTL